MVRLGAPLEGSSPAIESLSLDFQTNSLLVRERGYTQLQEINQMINDLQLRMPCEGRGGERRVGGINVDLHRVPPIGPGTGMGSLPIDTKPLTEAKTRDLKRELGTLKRQKLWAEISVEKLRMSIRGTILSEADLVAATLSSSGKQQFLDHILLEDLAFDTAIIDEAAQTTEPSTLIPLRYGCRSLVLVGDPRQLPATVLSPRAERAGLGRSLFERLEGAGHEVVMLTVQYRMHPEIRLFPSAIFYQGQLVDAKQITDEIVKYKETNVIPTKNNVLCGLLSVWGLYPVTFLDLSSEEERVGKSFKVRTHTYIYTHT
jgi:AAA domain